jgi:hypothetical protein
MPWMNVPRAPPMRALLLGCIRLRAVLAPVLSPLPPSHGAEGRHGAGVRAVHHLQTEGF